MRPVKFNLSARWSFAAFVVVAVLVKLWLTSDIRILAAFAPHDSSNFIEHAKSIMQGRWFGDYDVGTLIKVPAFPIFMAVVAEFGIPLPLAHQLLYVFACLVACAAIRPLVRSKAAIAAIFAVLLFNPFTYGTLVWAAYRSQLNESLCLLSVACAIAIYVRRTAPQRHVIPWLIGFGASFSAFWLTREESVWLVPCVVVIFSAYFVAVRRAPRAELALRLAGLAVPVVMVVASIGAVMLTNGLIYGWYTTSEQQAPEFVSAYNALARIVPPVPEDRVPVPRSARAIAYRVSARARELQPTLEGAVGKGWTTNSCGSWGVCNDIGGGWFVWAFRDAVALSGHYTSAASARSFYVAFASELDRACDSRVIACRPKGRTLAPPLAPAQVPAVFSHFAYAVRSFASLSTLTLARWPAGLVDPHLRADFEFVTRAVAIPSSDVSVYNGWLLHDSSKRVDVFGTDRDASATVAFSSSADVLAALSGSGIRIAGDTGMDRFAITTSCQVNCSLGIESEGKPIRIPLDPARPDFQTADLRFHLESVTGLKGYTSATAGFKNGALEAIANLYRTVFPFWLAAIAIFAVLRLVQSLRTRTTLREDTVLILGVFLSGSLLLVLLAVIDTISFPAISVEYLDSLYPVVLVACAVASAVEAARLPLPRLAKVTRAAEDRA
jgi:hypothetical protein